MHFFTVFAFFSIIAATKAGITKEKAIEAFRAIATGCAAEIGATEEDVKDMMNHLPANKMETKCLRACVMKEFGIMTVDGKFDAAKALEMSELHTQGDPEKYKIAETITSICSSIDVPDDHCEAAELYKMCLKSEATKHGINITD